MTIVRGMDPGTGLGLRVRVEGGVITEIEHDDADEPGVYLVPGLVDLQVNGYGGFDINGPDVSPDVVVAMLAALAAEGTTTTVPTVITGSHDAISRSVAAVAQACESEPDAAASVPFVHVEGPHLSEVDGPRGAHDLAHIRPPSLDEFDDWQTAARGLIGMVTISPHWPGSAVYVAGLVTRGIRVAVGHTHATSDQLREVVDAGACYSTHLGNGIAANLPRHPNAIWTQLAEDRLSAGFIADGHHLPDDTLRAMIRAKGIERSFVVSDSVAVAGSPPGVYAAPVGGSVELSEDGRLNVAGTPYLAGAALCLRAAIGTLVRAGFSLDEALQLVTARPGSIAGKGGSIASGARADLLVFSLGADGRVHVRQSWWGGRRVA